eukprot:7538673-Alexandrium_andersonii.AAC.1
MPRLSSSVCLWTSTSVIPASSVSLRYTRRVALGCHASLPGLGCPDVQAGHVCVVRAAQVLQRLQ